MGTSVGMIEAALRALIDTARESLLERLEAFTGAASGEAAEGGAVTH